MLKNKQPRSADLNLILYINYLFNFSGQLFNLAWTLLFYQANSEIPGVVLIKICRRKRLDEKN